MALKIKDSKENRRKARYFKRYYGWMPANHFVERLKFQSLGTLMRWCARRDIPTILG